MAVYGGPNVVDSGLVLSLDAGNARSYPGSGTTWTDISSGGRTGTLTNGPTYSANNGGAIVFDGTNDYVETTYTPGTISAHTMSCWINKTNLEYSFILSKSTSYYGLEIYPTVIYVNVGVGSFNYGEVSYNTNGWQNIAFTYDGSQTGNSNRLKIYFNGNNQTATYGGTIPASVNVSDVMQIARRYWGPTFGQAEYSSGSVAQLSVYNRALTAAEIAQNFNALRGRFGI